MLYPDGWERQLLKSLPFALKASFAFSSSFTWNLQFGFREIPVGFRAVEDQEVALPWQGRRCFYSVFFLSPVLPSAEEGSCFPASSTEEW